MVDLTLYTSRMNAYKDGTKDSEITSIQDDIKYEFKSNPSYQQILYNAVNKDAHIVDNNKSFTKKVGEKKLLGYPNDVYTVGDYLTLFSKTWIILSKDEDSVVQEKCYISVCNENLLINDNGTYKVYSCMIEASSLGLGLDENNPFDVSNGVIKLTVKKDNLTQSLLEGQRFIFGNKRTFKITNINDFISNIMMMTLQRDAFNESTDKQIIISGKQYWIANYSANPTPLPTGTEIIITPDVNYVKKTNTFGTDFTAKTYVNGVAVVDTFVVTIDGTSTALVGDYTFTTVDSDTFNIKSNVSNKKVVVKIQSVSYPLVSVLKTVNLMLY